MSAKRKRPLKKLVSMLGSEDATERRTAAKGLGEWDERAAYPLIKALRDENRGVQDAAINSLVSIGGEAVAYMLLPLLREDSFIRNTALLMLAEFGQVSVPLLYPMLTDRDDDIRKFALDLLGDIGVGADPLKIVPLLSDPNANVRASAVRALGLLGHHESIPAIRRMLCDEEWVCFAALETLAAFRDEGAVDEVIKLLAHESLAVRISAVEVLGSIGSQKASEALVKHVAGDCDFDEKTAAVKSLVVIGLTPDMAEIANLLLDLLAEATDWEDRIVALQGLADIRHPEAIPVAIDIAGALDESVPGQDEILIQFKHILERFGPSEIYGTVLADPEMRYKGREIAAEMAGITKSESAVPALIEFLGSDLRDVRRACAVALGRIGTQEAVGALMKAVDDPESNVRKMAIASLGLPGNAQAFDLLLGHLEKERYDDIVEETVRSLMAIDTPRLAGIVAGMPARVRTAAARSAYDLGLLLALADDPDAGIAMAALSGLGRFKDQRALERIMKAVRDTDAGVRRTAVVALGGMDVGFDSIKPLLRDTDMWVRLHAVRNLGSTMLQDAVGALEPMLDDPEMPVVYAAIEALTSIGGPEAFTALNRKAGHASAEVRDAVATALERFC